MAFKGWDRSLWTKSYPEIWYKEGYAQGYRIGKDPLFRHVYNNALRLRERTAMIYYGRHITWEEYIDLILRAANSLKEMGVRKGDRVYMGMLNCPQFFISYFAIHSVGGVAIPLSPGYKKGEISHVINNSGAKVLIIQESVVPLYDELKDQLPSVEHVVAVKLDEYVPDDPYPEFPADLRSKSAALPAGVITWLEFVSSEQIDDFADVDINDLAQLQYTSGTTGRPKGAMLTHKNILHGAFLNGMSPTLTVDGVAICALPMFHVTALNDLVNAPMLFGAAVVIMTRFDPEGFLQAVERYKPNYTVLATPVVVMISNNPAFGKYDISSLKVLGMGGAAMPVAVAESYLARGVTLTEGYGMSETCATTISNTRRSYKLGTIGMPCPGTDIRIVDITDANRDVGLNKEGELWVKSASCGIGYWDNEKESKETFLEGGWVRTGDIVKMDEDGFVTHCGRLKELVKVSAYSVFPAEVEEYMYAHPAVVECCAIGVPHPVKGEEIKMFVVLKPDYIGKVTAEDLIEWAKGEMAAYKYPRHIEFRVVLPKLASGKISRKDLKEEEKARLA